MKRKLFEDIAKANHKNYYPELTGLRGMAALWVMLFHIRGETGVIDYRFNFFDIHLDVAPLFGMGGLGVYLFFVLSGFLLSMPFIRWMTGDADYPMLKGYYIRRIARVFPAYYAQLLTLLLVIYLAGDGFVLSIKNFILHLFMLFHVEPWFAEPLEGVWWTLPTEFGFYLALPLIAAIFKKTGMAWGLISAILLTIFFRYIFYFSSLEVNIMIIKTDRNFPVQLSLFVIGMVSAYLFYQLNKINYRLKPLVLWAIFIVGVGGFYGSAKLLEFLAISGCYFSGHYSYFMWNSFNALFIGCIVFVSAYRLWICRYLLGNRFCVFLGTISYSFYLWHFPVMKFAQQYLFITDYDKTTQHLLISLPLTIIISMLSYQFIEVPGIRLGSKLSKRMG